MNRIKRIWILGLLLIGASCNSWLDVAPEDPDYGKRPV